MWAYATESKFSRGGKGEQWQNMTSFWNILSINCYFASDAWTYHRRLVDGPEWDWGNAL